MRSSAVLLLACACGSGLDSMGLGSLPLVTVRGQVDLAAMPAQGPLRATLVWAGVPQVDVGCYDFRENSDLAAHCPDPYWFRPGSVEPSVPVAADGSFALSLDHLPGGSVSVGDASARIAYASFVVAEDSDRDGELSITNFGFGGDGFRGGGGGGEPGGGPGGRLFQSGPQASPRDRVLGATFWSLHAEQRRFVFREGGFDADSYFFPLPGCAAPAKGFSLLTAPDMRTPGGCTFASADTLVTVPPIGAGAVPAIVCQQRGSSNRRTDEEDRPDPRTPSICLSREVLAVFPAGLCPIIHLYKLRGCGNESETCTEPDWDNTASPPSWWPC